MFETVGDFIQSSIERLNTYDTPPDSVQMTCLQLVYTSFNAPVGRFSKADPSEQHRVAIFYGAYRRNRGLAVKGCQRIAAAVPSDTYLTRCARDGSIPELVGLKAEWRVIREETLALYKTSRTRVAGGYDDIRFNSLYARVGNRLVRLHRASWRRITA